MRSSSEQLEVKTNQQDWQKTFCEMIDFDNKRLPWTQLLVDQFELSKSMKLACLCEPVLVQMTHRGAYMLGQEPLGLTPNDAIRIVTKINEVLMEAGEQLFLVDANRWLYACNADRFFSSQFVEELIGKDLFNFRYQGKDAAYFQKLNTEIQMLIKQMIDYGELPPLAAELIINVHFSDPVLLGDLVEIPFIQNDKILVVSSNEIIQSFCAKTFLAHQTIDAFQPQVKADNILFGFDSEKTIYPELLNTWFEQGQKFKPVIRQIVCYDATISPAKSTSIWRRMFAR